MEKNCLICNESFKVYPSTIRARRFCSYKCAAIGRTGVKRPDIVKINEARKGIKTGQIPWNKGKKNVYSKEQLQNIKNGWKKAIKSGHIAWNKGKPVSLEEKKRLAQMNADQSRSSRITSIENKVMKELDERGIKYEFQAFIKNKWSCDFYIPSLNLIIEADGDYWHSQPKTIKKDKSKNKYLKKCGFNLLRLSESIINDNSFIKELNLWL